MISYSTQGRQQFYELTSQAIRRAIQYCHMNDTLTPKNKLEMMAAVEANGKQGEETDPVAARAHDSDDDDRGFLLKLKKALLSKYGTAQAAFEALSTNGPARMATEAVRPAPGGREPSAV